ncbi:MAG: outer membrane beta-barrel protein [Bdellovibrionota bacterium]
MKKTTAFFALAALAAVLAAAPARAEDAISMKGIGISGYVDAVMGLSRTSGDFASTGTSLPGLYAGKVSLATGAGISETDFTFAATEFKMHFNKDFGDKASAVASLSILGLLSPSQTLTDTNGDTVTVTSPSGFALDLQQAAVKLNFGDAHFMLGRFYAPIGIETVDANSRATITLGNVFNNLEPFFLTGAMLHYAPEEGPGGFLILANGLGGNNNECINDTAPPPSTPPEDTPPACLTSDPSTLGKAVIAGVTYVGGGVSATLQYNVDWAGDGSTKVFEDATQILDLSVLYDSDSFMAGMDALYRRDNVLAANADTFGLELMGAAKMDDLVAGIRGDLIHAIDNSGVGIQPDGSVYMVSPFVTYTVIDGVFVRGEYRYDAIDPAGSGNYLHSNLFLVQANATFQ